MNVDEPGRYHGSAEGESTDLDVTNRILKAIPKTARGHTVAAIGEFIGTM